MDYTGDIRDAYFDYEKDRYGDQGYNSDFLTENTTLSSKKLYEPDNDDIEF